MMGESTIAEDIAGDADFASERDATLLVIVYFLKQTLHFHLFALFRAV